MSKDSLERPLSLPRHLKFRIKNGEYHAQVSQNLGEFVLGVEILELLRLIDQGTVTSEKDHKAVTQSLTEALQMCPKSKDLQLLLEDLVAAGVVRRSNTKSPLHSPAAGDGAGDRFADGWIQWAMLADETRVARYREAIRKILRPGQVAVDLGAGNGILSYLLLRSGADKVIALEESNASITMRKVLRKVLPSRGPRVEEPWVVLHGNASDTLNELKKQVPKGADVLVSELFGHDPFSEGMLPTLREIQGELHSLASSVRSGHRTALPLVSIPHSVTVMCSFARLTPSPSHSILERILLWNRSRGIGGGATKPPSQPSELEEFRKAFASTESFETLSFAAPLRTSDFELKGHPARLMHLSLNPVPPRTETERVIKTEMKVPEIQDSSVILVWFESELAPGIRISTLPGSPDSCQHWNPILIPLREPIQRGQFAHIEAELVNDETHLSLTFSQNKKVFAGR